MKTTLDLPDDLMREVRARAAADNCAFKATVADLLRKGLAQPSQNPEDENDEPQIRKRVEFPLFKGGHPATPGEEVTPERLDEILAEQEARWVHGGNE